MKNQFYVLICILTLYADEFFVDASNQNIYERYSNREYMSTTLPTILAECRSSKTRRQYNLRDCNDAEYLDAVQKMYINLQSQAPEGVKVTLPSSIKSFDRTTGFQKLFQDNIVTRRPFKSTMESANEHWKELCGSWDEMAHNHITSDYSLHNCPNYKNVLADKVKIPIISSNSYVTRINSSNLTRIQDESSEFVSEVSSLDFKLQWPSFLSVEVAESTPVMKCPAKMHQVVWGAGKYSFKARLFPDLVSHLMQPTTSGPNSLHYPTFSRKGFEDTQPMPRYLETSISGSEFLFIPENMLASFTLSPMETGGVEKSGLLLRQCFVDASNFVDFQEALSISSKVSSMDHSILALLSSPSFDSKMTRSPLEMSLRDFHNYTIPSNTNTINSDISSESSLKAEKRSRRVGRQGQGNNFREWQELNKWNLMISSLTMPRPPIPTISSMGRRNASLQWESTYLPSSLDRSRFGYNITYCQESESEISSDSLNASNSTCETKVFERGSQNPAEYLHISLSDVNDHVTFDVVVHDLIPGTSYRFRSTLFYDSTGSSMSGWTNPMMTKANTVPAPVSNIVATPGPAHYDLSPGSVILSMTKPIDDGGFPIKGFQVLSLFIPENEMDKPISKLASSKLWKSCGVYSTSTTSANPLINVTVKNLLMGASYIFKVFPINELGHQSRSPISNKCTTLPPTKSDIPTSSILYGEGMNIDNTSAAGGRHAIESTNSHAIILSDVLQKVSIYGGSTFINAWRCHWTPQSFEVIAESIWADPPLVDTPLRNTDQIRNRIVWIMRGGIGLAFKVRKAYNAGAVGVILVDDGRCTTFNQKCMPGADKVRDEGFAALDIPQMWDNIRIPTLFVLKDDAIRLTSLIGLAWTDARYSNDEL